MKTELVEIFQTIRAGLQSFATRGYTVHKNTETAFDLFSEKNTNSDDNKVTERFLCGVYIKKQVVEVKMNTKYLESLNEKLIKFDENFTGYAITELDDAKLKDILLQIEIIHTKFKENEWI